MKPRLKLRNLRSRDESDDSHSLIPTIAFAYMLFTAIGNCISITLNTNHVGEVSGF